MPFRNAEKTLARAIKSISDQTFVDWEAVLVDDGSTDGSAAIAGQWAARDPRFRLLHMPRNLGAAQARNSGIRAARGRWIAFLDADDQWLSHKLTTQLPLLEAGAPIVFSAYERVDLQGRVLGVVSARKRVRYHDALHGNPIGCLTAVWDRNYFGPAQFPACAMHEDYAFWLMLLRGGAEARGVPDVLARYQVAAGSLSSHKLQAARAVWQILRAEPGLPLWQALGGFASYAGGALWRRRPRRRELR